MRLAALVTACILATCSPTWADNWLDRVVTERPTAIVRLPDGSDVLHCEAIAPAQIREVLASFPRTIPVFSEDHDGNRTKSIVCENATNTFLTAPRMRYPGIVLLTPAGSWQIDHQVFSITSGGLAPGERRLVPGSDDARLGVALDWGLERILPLISRRDRDPGIFIDYDHSGAPQGTTEVEVLRAIDRATLFWSSLLNAEFFEVTLQVRWRDLGVGVLAQALTTNRDDRSWSTVRNNLILTQFGPDFSFTETALYDNLPHGSSVRYYWPGGIASTTRICLPIPLLVKWEGMSADDPMMIELNSLQSWDFDGRLGTPAVAPNSFDFEAVFVHEVGHHFGFISETEALRDFFYDFVSNWDIFRFRESDGPAIDTGEMLGNPRGTEFGVPAISCTALNDPLRTFGMSTGIDSQASHWLDDVVGSGYIGLMDPSISVAQSLQNGITSADIQAFDVMGYEIDETALPVRVAPPEPVEPLPNIIVPQGQSVSLQWQSVNGAQSYTIGVDDLGLNGAGPGFLLASLTDFPGTVSPPLPSQLLQPGHIYRWYVNSQNFLGYARGPSRLFRISGGCLADFNAVGGVTVQDVFDFTDAFFRNDPRADVNGTGDVTPQDIFDFLTAWFAGC